MQLELYVATVYCTQNKCSTFEKRLETQPHGRNSKIQDYSIERKQKQLNPCSHMGCTVNKNSFLITVSISLEEECTTETFVCKRIFCPPPQSATFEQNGRRPGSSSLYTSVQ
jgi:hypothetical protein